MSRIRVAVLSAALGVMAFSATAEAQSYKFDLGLNGGFGYWTNMLTEKHTGVSDQDVKFDAGWLSGAQATLWLSPRFGLRANFGYTDRPVRGDDVPLTTVAADDLEHINLWSGTGDLMVRLSAPRPEFTGTEILPYIALGAGAKWQNPSGDRYTALDAAEGKTWNGVPFSTGTGTTQQNFFVSELKTVMGLVGIGTDVRFSPRTALRLEVGDRMFDPQFHNVTIPASGTQYTTVAGDEDVGKMVHEAYATVGLHMLFGLASRPEIAVVSAPAPMPVYTPPAPTPAPAPVVREEAITVCVIDPTAAGGIRTESAFYMPDTRDTLIVMNGSRRPLRDAVGNVVIASNADWYVKGQPFTMTVAGEKMQFVSYGSAHMVEGRELAFLGTVNGLPVYASRDEVSDVRSQLDDLNRANRGSDLQKILEQHKDLREALADVKVLYVPLQSTGCVFQPLQVQEQVRKNR